MPAPTAFAVSSACAWREATSSASGLVLVRGSSVTCPANEEFFAISRALEIRSSSRASGSTVEPLLRWLPSQRRRLPAPNSVREAPHLCTTEVFDPFHSLIAGLSSTGRRDSSDLAGEGSHPPRSAR